jgi:hypothetical protein
MWIRSRYSVRVMYKCDLGGCKRRRAHCRVKARARARPEHGGARPRTENARSVGCALTGLARRAATNADCGLRRSCISARCMARMAVRVLNGVTSLGV